MTQCVNLGMIQTRLNEARVLPGANRIRFKEEKLKVHSRKILLPMRSTTWGNDYGRKRCTKHCDGQSFPAGTGGTLPFPTRKDLQVGCSVGRPLSTLCLTKEWTGMRRRQGNPCPCPCAGLRRSMPTAARQGGGTGISDKLCSLGPG